jgi:hypothetical protein
MHELKAGGKGLRAAAEKENGSDTVAGYTETIMDKHYMSDCEGNLHSELSGHFARLSGKHEKPVYCLVSGEFDISNIGEMIEAMGYTKESVRGKRVTITIEENTSGEQ